ncbi:hypothetical protein LDO26_04680 [Luteimonas sp. BDR2-5]|uniref:hypothetical protein n=1 Tax=Proluteimonas luteida TaxID=2878685 RepID=UPI001E37B75A|nr:hypothetical protein [Luteimonas sp. BDR2-5]MCD9027509.1 hypothetical protein [Luteimonas sp. BDR2-5]
MSIDTTSCAARMRIDVRAKHALRKPHESRHFVHARIIGAHPCDAATRGSRAGENLTTHPTSE